MPAAPGWNPDPSGRGGERWWDGSGWTEHVRPSPSGAPAPGPTPPPPPPPPPPGAVPPGPPAPPPVGAGGAAGGPKKKRSPLPLVLGGLAVLVVLALVAVGLVVVLAGGDDPELTWDGDEVAEPEAVLTRGEAALDAVVEERSGATVDSTRCYFVQTREDESDVADALACGPVLFVDGDPDEAWMRFGLRRSGRDTPVELRVDETPEEPEPGGRPRGTLFRPDGEEAPRGSDGIEAPAPPPAEAGLFVRDDGLVADLDLETASGDARIVSFAAEYVLDGSAVPERVGEGDEARSPAEGERFVVFELAQGLGEGTLALEDDLVRVRVGDGEPLPLPDVDDAFPFVDGRYLLSAPEGDDVELVVTTATDVELRLSLVDAVRTDDGTASVLLRDDRQADIGVGAQPLPFNLSSGGTTSPVFTVSVEVTTAELRYFQGEDGTRVPEDPAGAWLVIAVQYSWPGELLALDPGLADAGLGPEVWNLRTPAGRTIAAQNVSDVDGRIVIGFPVPADIVGGTFVVGGTEPGSVVFDTGPSRAEVPFEIPE